MSKEELLKPRYMVIAEYPDNEDFPIGKIIEFESYMKYYWKYNISDCKGERTWLSEYFNKYPHIFKKLEWWEERDLKDLPEYVKDEKGKIVTINSVIEMNDGKSNLIVCKDIMRFYEPATEEQYLL